jgi:Sortase domain
MARISAVLGRRVQGLHREVGAFVFVVTLGVTLAFTWSDGTPADDPLDADSVSSSGFASQDPANNVYLDESFLASRPRVVTPPPQSPPGMPTAPPVQLLIPLLDVHRAVEKVGADRFGVMDLPTNSWNAGWFKWGPIPGAPGDAVIEGHAGYPGQPMIFGKLDTLRPGDRIIVVLSDKTRRLFLVVSKKTVPAGSAPPGLADPYGPPRLTLVTCAGHFNKARYSYASRLLVETRYAGLV